MFATQYPTSVSSSAFQIPSFSLQKCLGESSSSLSSQFSLPSDNWLSVLLAPHSEGLANAATRDATPMQSSQSVCGNTPVDQAETKPTPPALQTMGTVFDEGVAAPRSQAAWTSDLQSEDHFAHFISNWTSAYKGDTGTSHRLTPAQDRSDTTTSLAMPPSHSQPPQHALMVSSPLGLYNAAPQKSASLPESAFPFGGSNMSMDYMSAPRSSSKPATASPAMLPPLHTRSTELGSQQQLQLSPANIGVLPSGRVMASGPAQAHGIYTPFHETPSATASTSSAASNTMSVNTQPPVFNTSPFAATAQMTPYMGASMLQDRAHMQTSRSPAEPPVSPLSMNPSSSPGLIISNTQSGWGPFEADSSHRRSPAACNFCRKRKLRCDGKSPCRQCARRNVECVVSEAANSRRLRRAENTAAAHQTIAAGRRASTGVLPRRASFTAAPQVPHRFSATATHSAGPASFAASMAASSAVSRAGPMRANTFGASGPSGTSSSSSMSSASSSSFSHWDPRAPRASFLQPLAFLPPSTTATMSDQRPALPSDLSSTASVQTVSSNGTIASPMISGSMGLDIPGGRNSNGGAGGSNSAPSSSHLPSFPVLHHGASETNVDTGYSVEHKDLLRRQSSSSLSGAGLTPP